MNLSVEISPSGNYGVIGPSDHANRYGRDLRDGRSQDNDFTHDGSTRSLPEWSAQLKTRSGLKLNVRPAVPEDEPELIRFLKQVSPDDLRFRFLSAVGNIGHSLAQPLIEIDHERTENLLAFDARDGRLAATAMIVEAGCPESARISQSDL